MADVTAFHLRGIPLHWTESDLLNALEDAGVSGILLVQCMTKLIVLKSGERLIVTNGDALVLFTQSEGRVFLDELLLKYNIPGPYSGIRIQVRKLDLPQKVPELQREIAQNLAAGDSIKCNIPMGVFYEFQSRNLRVREEMLRINYQRLQLECSGECKEYLMTNRPNKLLALRLVMDNKENDVTTAPPDMDLVMVRLDGRVPCFKLPVITNNNCFGTADEEAPITEISCEIRKLPERYPTSKTTLTDSSSSDEHGDVMNNTTSPESYLDARVTTSSSSQSSSSEPPQLPLTNLKREDADTCPIYVKGLYDHWNAWNLSDYFEKELNCKVKFSAIYSKYVQGEETQNLDFILQIPKGHGVILFTTLAAETECLERGAFYPAHSDLGGDDEKRILVVEKAFGADLIKDVYAAVKLHASVLCGLTPTETQNFKNMYEAMHSYRHKLLLQNKNEMKHMHGKHKTLFKVLEFYWDWWKEKRDEIIKAQSRRHKRHN